MLFIFCVHVCVFDSFFDFFIREKSTQNFSLKIMPPKRKRGATVKAASSKAKSIKASGGDEDGDEDNAADDDTTHAGVGGPKKKKMKMKNDEQQNQQQPTTNDETTTKTERTCTPPPPPKTCPYLSFVNRPLLDFRFRKKMFGLVRERKLLLLLNLRAFFRRERPKDAGVYARVGTRKPLRVHALGKWQSVLSSG